MANIVITSTHILVFRVAVDLAYLDYRTAERSGHASDEQKDAPPVARKLIQPLLIVRHQHAEQDPHAAVDALENEVEISVASVQQTVKGYIKKTY